MPRQKSVLKLQGTLDGLTYYQSEGKHLVRRKSSLDRNRVLTDPKFGRTRENFQEFQHVSTSGKMIRQALQQSFSTVASPRIHLLMNSLLSRIIKLDTVNERGQRTIAEGLATPEGRALLTKFSLNHQVPFDQIVRVNPTVDPTTGIITINGLVPLEMIAAPPGATHVGFQSEWTRLDLATGAFDTVVTTATPVPLDTSLHNIILQRTAAPQGSGLVLIAFTVRFFQSLNDNLYPLNDGSYQTGTIFCIR
jgi:hypothetical protein